MPKKEDLNGVSGWLLFFIITLVFITPIINLGTVFDPSLGTYLTFEMLGEMSLYILTGIFLWKRKSYAVKFAKVYLITIGILSIIYSFYLSNFSYLMGLPYCVIWTLYLYNSKRVAQTYGKLKEKTVGYQIWPKIAIIYSFIVPVCGAVFAVVSLISISKNRKLKGIFLSVIALIISIILFFYLSFYLAAAGGYAPESIKTECNDFCYNVAGASAFIVEYSSSEAGYVCNCIDEAENVVDKKTFKENSATSGLTGGVIGSLNKPVKSYNVFPGTPVLIGGKYAPVKAS